MKEQKSKFIYNEEDKLCISQCYYCVHFNYKEAEKKTCKAFPDGIPEEIFSNTILHTTPYKNDHGILFIQK